MHSLSLLSLSLLSLSTAFTLFCSLSLLLSFLGITHTHTHSIAHKHTPSCLFASLFFNTHILSPFSLFLSLSLPLSFPCWCVQVRVSALFNTTFLAIQCMSLCVCVRELVCVCMSVCVFYKSLLKIFPEANFEYFKYNCKKNTNFEPS